MASKALSDSMGALRWLYAVVAGFAVTAAVQKWALDSKDNVDFRFNGDLAVLVMFMLVVVRFAHGAIRHFQLSYDQRTGNCGWYEPLVDFFALFVEAVFFLLMAYSLQNHPQFAVLYLLLLATDTVWICICLCSKHQSSGTLKNWLVANAVFLAAIPVLALNKGDTALLPTLGLLTAFHTVLDYVLPDNWDYYFPGVAKPPAVASIRKRLNGHWIWKSAITSC